jgi:hypothetical protein
MGRSRRNLPRTCCSSAITTKAPMARQGERASSFMALRGAEA